MTWAAKRGSQVSQLSSGLSSALRTLVFLFSWDPKCWRAVVSLLVQLCPHDRWPFNHPHKLWSAHIWVISCSIHCHISKWFCKKKTDTWSNRQEMKWYKLLDLSVPNKSLQFDHTSCLVSTNQNLVTCLYFLGSWNRNRRHQLRSYLMSLLHSNNNAIRCCPPTQRSSTPISVNNMSWIFIFLFLSTRGILRIQSCSGKICFQWFLIFIVSHFDIITGRFNWLNVITNWSQIYDQSFRWTYERTALPYSTRANKTGLDENGLRQNTGYFSGPNFFCRYENFNSSHCCLRTWNDRQELSCILPMPTENSFGPESSIENDSLANVKLSIFYRCGIML